MKEQQLNVVIAADAPEDRAALRDALSRDTAARYVVIETQSGAHAVEMCRERSPDCLILDRGLRDLSGLDALKELAADEGLPACAVVVLTGEGDAQFAVEAMKSGADDCLEKRRARGEALPGAIRKAIEKAELRRRAAAREHEFMEKNRALEDSLSALKREDGWREEVKEAWQVARAGGAVSGAIAPGPERTGYILGGELLRLLNAAIEQSDESVIITTAQLDHPGPQIVY